MSVPRNVWVLLLWLFALGNLAGVWSAAYGAEPWHATLHAALALGAALWAEGLRRRRPPEGAAP